MRSRCSSYGTAWLVQREVQALLIVPRVDQSDERAMTRGKRGEVLTVEQLPVESGEESFRDGVIPSLPPPTHVRETARVRDGCQRSREIS